MNNIKTIIIFFIVFVFSNQIVLGQKSADSIIFNAMHDELERSLQLQSKNYGKPFFVAFTLMFQNKWMIQSQQGALIASQQRKFTDATWRLMIGDYSINDENFEDKSNPGSNDIFYDLVKPPLYPDYWGIRNVLWLSANYSYKRAAPSYKNKIDIIEKHNLYDNKELLPDFSQQNTTELFVNRPPFTVNKNILEQKSRLYSEIYKYHPEIIFSEANINIVQNDIYFLSTEKSKFLIPFDVTHLSVRLKKNISDDPNAESSLSVSVLSPSDLPSDKDVLNEIEKIVDHLNKLEKAQNIEENYTGPVLFEGEIVGKVLLSSLFAFDFSLTARRNNLVFENYNKVYFDENTNNLQSKIDEKILPDHVSIVSYPHLKEYMGKPLIGYFDIDSEGVIPEDSLIIVKNGVLKQLFADRIPTTANKVSNGYRRFSFNYNGIRVRTAPGTLQINTVLGEDTKLLKNKLLQIAKEKGYKYAYILRSIPSSVASMPVCCFQINVEDGTEVLIKDVSLIYALKPHVLKNIRGLSDSTLLYNGLWGQAFYHLDNQYKSNEGLPISLIFPSAMLVDEAEINTIQRNKNLNTIFEEISNPLKRDSGL